MNYKEFVVFVLCILGIAVNLSAQVPMGGSFEIRFHDYRNYPIEGVTVNLENQTSKGIIYSTYSNSEGYARIFGIKPDTYLVSVKKEGYLPVRSTSNITRNDEVRSEWQLEESPEKKSKRLESERLATPTPVRSPTPLPEIIRKYITIKSHESKLSELPDNDRIRFTGYCKQGCKCHPPAQSPQIQSMNLDCQTADYHGVIRSVYEQLNQGKKPDSIKFPTDDRMISYMCYLRYSENAQYTGILLVSRGYYDDGVPQHFHFVLLDPGGNIKWEMEHKMLEGSHFPDDNVKYSNDMVISNQGHTLLITAKQHIVGSSEDYITGWMLLSSTGKQIAENQTFCRFPLMLNSHSRFLVQQQQPSGAMTAAFNLNGELIWSDEHIHSFDNGYLKSPSEEKMIGQLRGGMCIFNPDGRIIASVRGYPEDSEMNMVNPIWLRNESILIGGRGVDRLNFCPVTTFKNIMQKFETDYGLLSIQTIVPMSESTYICAGFRSTGRGRLFIPESQYKFVGLLDDQFDLTGIRFFTTPTGNNKTLEVHAVPSKSEFMIRTALETITGRISSENDIQEVVFPETPTPEPTWTPRSTITPAPPGFAGCTAWGDDSYWGFFSGASISVSDPDLNSDPNQVEYCIVHVNSDSDPKGFDVVLCELYQNSTVFFNILGYDALRFTSGSSQEGRCLHVEDGDEITLVYEEQSPRRSIKSTAVWHALEYYPPP